MPTLTERFVADIEGLSDLPSLSPVLAHLIATKDQLPQTRERRRAEPEQAVALYAAAGAETPLRPGRKLRRTM